MKLRVLIADDEPLNRQRLRDFLRAEPDAEFVAECATGLEAVMGIREKSPDVALLDVKMPGLDGFDVAASLNGARRPAIIFVTAYDQFAVRAFEANAVDYLLKPFDRERFHTAFQRARERLRPGAPAILRPALVNLLAEVGPRPPILERVAIKSEGRIAVVNLIEIDWVSAADNYVELHVGRATHLLRMTLSILAEQLSPTGFARISRSHLVNLHRIKEIRSKSHGDYLVVLHDGTALPGSRNYRQNLARFLGKSL